MTESGAVGSDRWYKTFVNNIFHGIKGVIKKQVKVYWLKRKNYKEFTGFEEIQVEKYL